MAAPFSISIVVITRNTRDLLRDLLLSIERDKALHPMIAGKIVVDNGSTDGTAEMVREIFPSVKLLENGRNLGFARAANAGIRLSSGDAVLLLNSDTVLLEGELSKMVAFMEGHPDVGLCGPMLVYPDMKPQRSFAPVPSLLLEFFPEGLMERLYPSKYPGKRAMPHDPTLVDSLIGAAIALRRNLLSTLNGFDERFFFFLEETDLCVRARKAGFRVVFFPDAKIIHLQGKTVRKSWVKGRIQYNISLYKFVRKHHETPYFCVFAAVRLLKAILFLTVTSVLFPLLIRKRTRLSYSYYLRLVGWHFRGCPDRGGLEEPQ